MNDLAIKALSYYGMSEVKGKASNPRLLALIQRHAHWINNDDNIAWCAIFIKDLCQQLGLPIPTSNPMAARSWLKVGCEIPVDQMQTGDLIIFWRKSEFSWQGHVAIYINDFDENYIRVLGGNQGDAVTITKYAKHRILGVRRLYRA